MGQSPLGYEVFVELVLDVALKNKMGEKVIKNKKIKKIKQIKKIKAKKSKNQGSIFKVRRFKLGVLFNYYNTQVVLLLSKNRDDHSRGYLLPSNSLCDL